MLKNNWLDIIFFIFILSVPSIITRDPQLKTFYIVWNVGQGQSTSFINQHQCFHFDMGGERFPKKIVEYCQKKINILFISHRDWDHINFSLQLKRKLKNLCLHSAPPGTTSRNKDKLFQTLPFCPQKLILEFHQKAQILNPTITINKSKKTKSLKSSNSLSRIAILNKTILIPGDSPTTEEKKWIHQLQQPKKIQLLLLGHHGSKTSTSNELLQNLSNLKVAVASARIKKYGHPHSLVRAHLKRKKIPILLTEEWGNIMFEL